MAHPAVLLQGCGRRAVSATLPAMPPAVMAEALGTRPDTVANHVSGAANGVDERTVEALVDLRSQPRDMHVNNVGLRVSKGGGFVPRNARRSPFSGRHAYRRPRPDARARRALHRQAD